MTKHIASGFLPTLTGLTAVAAAAALVAACGSGGTTDTPVAAAAIDTASVNTAIADYGDLFGICKAASADGISIHSSLGRTLGSLMFDSLSLAPRTLPAGVRTRLALTSTPPADTLGSCGGRAGYRNYSHVNGVTTATLSFEGYCTTNQAGNKEVMNGGIAFTNTATPTASGPITTQMVASTSTTLTVAESTPTGTALGTQSLSVTDFKIVMGVPGGTPTAANPDVLTLGDLSVRNSSTGKNYHQSNYEIRYYQTSTGSSVYTIAGQGYRSSGATYGVATTQPIIEDSSGNTVSGVVTFTGANGSKAVATLVPGSKMQATLTVNGTPVTSVPTCVAGS